MTNGEPSSSRQPFGGQVVPPAELQTPLHQKIGDELITLTPDHWRYVRLRLARVPEGEPNAGCLSHIIESAEGHPEVVVPGDALFALTHELDALFREYGAVWKQAVYHVREGEPDNWRVVADFSY